MGGYPIIPNPQKSNSLSTRALSNFSLCLFISGLYCDGHNLMCYFKLQPCLSFLYLQRRVFLILPFLRPISNSALVINYVRISGFPSRQVTSQKLLYFRVFSLFNVILFRHAGEARKYPLRGYCLAPLGRRQRITLQREKILGAGGITDNVKDNVTDNGRTDRRRI